MFRSFLLFCILNSVLSSGTAQWLPFADSTATRLVLSSVPANDDREKDIATADFDKNGWQDIVVVRKEPFSSIGPEPDLLLMNYDGVLIDSTAMFAPEFLSTASDARDVLAGDVNGDGWIDLVIANTFTQQPILYLNLGLDGGGNWLGFADSSATHLPILTITPLQFCAVWGGDITGNGALDLYFSNYAQSGGCDDVLLINDGTGHFTDESQSRLGNLRTSAFGTSVEIHDMDNDGDQDIVKISTLYNVAPWNDRGVYLLFNDGTGNFSNWVSVTTSTSNPYMFTITDFDDDGMKDVYVVDDNQDYIRMAATIIVDTSVTFTTSTIVNPRTTGFGGNCKIADLDCDLDPDLGICDVDVDIQPCESGASLRKYTMMENDGSTLINPYASGDSIWNVSAFDFAFFDLDNDGTQDIFLGRCSSYSVLLNSGLSEPCTSYIGTRIYVDSSATGAADGTSWTNAFVNLQQALYAAEYCSTLDTIFIAKGTYLPCSGLNRYVSFNLPDGVDILGGFPSGGGTLAARDPGAFLTILSGDIGALNVTADNALHVLRIDSNTSCTIDGVTIQQGVSDGTGFHASGAGLYCQGTLSLNTVHFSENSGTGNGYAIYNAGTLTFIDCTVQVSMGMILPPVFAATGSIATFQGMTIIH